MPIVVKDFQWSETLDTVFVQVPLKGVVPSKTDVYSNDSYIKVNYPPYLFELDLLYPIQHGKSIASVGNGVVKFTLVKVQKYLLGGVKIQKLEEGGKLWGEITFMAKSRDTLLERRAQAQARQLEEDQAEKQRIREIKVIEHRGMVEKQMAVEQQRREAVEVKKEQEKVQAQSELSEWIQKSGNQLQSEIPQILEDAKGMFNEPYSVAKADSVVDDIDIEAITAKVKAQLKAKERPSPRGSGAQITIKFTSRGLIPTKTARESEDAKWLLRIQQMTAAHERKAALEKAMSAEGKDGETTTAGKFHEAHPNLLKTKAANFYKAGNFGAAINAYSEVLNLDPENLQCLSNRSACYLQLERWIECVEDCTEIFRILELQDALLREHLVQEGEKGITRRINHRVKCLVRMGTARANMGDLGGSVKNYEAALQITPNDVQIKADLEALRIRYPCPVTTSPSN